MVHHLAAGDRHLDPDGLGGRIAAGEVDDDVLDGLARHLLRRVDGGAQRELRLLHVNDGAVPHAAGDLVPDAGDGRAAILGDARDEAAHLAGSDVECGDQAVARCDARFFDHVALSFGLSPAGASDSSGFAG
jgi:hypothetical protein